MTLNNMRFRYEGPEWSLPADDPVVLAHPDTFRLWEPPGYAGVPWTHLLRLRRYFEERFEGPPTELVPAYQEWLRARLPAPPPPPSELSAFADYRARRPEDSEYMRLQQKALALFNMYLGYVDHPTFWVQPGRALFSPFAPSLAQLHVYWCEHGHDAPPHLGFPAPADGGDDVEWEPPGYQYEPWPKLVDLRRRFMKEAGHGAATPRREYKAWLTTVLPDPRQSYVRPPPCTSRPREIKPYLEEFYFVQTMGLADREYIDEFVAHTSAERKRNLKRKAKTEEVEFELADEDVEIRVPAGLADALPKSSLCAADLWPGVDPVEQAAYDAHLAATVPFDSEAFPKLSAVPIMPAAVAVATSIRGDFRPLLAHLDREPEMGDVAANGTVAWRPPVVVVNPAVRAVLAAVPGQQPATRIVGSVFCHVAGSASQDRTRADVGRMVAHTLSFRAAQLAAALSLRPEDLEQPWAERAWLGFLVNPDWLFNLHHEKHHAADMGSGATNLFAWAVGLLKAKDQSRPICNNGRTRTATTTHEILGLDFSCQTKLHVSPVNYHRFPRDRELIRVIMARTCPTPHRSESDLVSAAIASKALASLLDGWCGAAVSFRRSHNKNLMHVSCYWFGDEVFARL